MGSYQDAEGQVKGTVDIYQTIFEWAAVYLKFIDIEYLAIKMIAIEWYIQFGTSLLVSLRLIQAEIFKTQLYLFMSWMLIIAVRAVIL